MKRNWWWRLFVRMCVAVGGVGLVFLCLGIHGCSPAHDPWEETEGEGPKVLVSFPPLYCFVKKVGGDHVKVRSLCENVSPHDFDPSAATVTEAQKADLFLVNGLGLDNWFKQIVSSSGNKKLKVIRIGEYLPNKLKVFRTSGSPDPHAWLGIEPAIKMVEIIRDKLIEAAPEHKETYVENAKNYIAELKDLKKFGEEQFKGLKKRPIVPWHDAMKYFAKSFDLDLGKSIRNESAGGSMSVAEFTKLVKESVESKARVILYEPGHPKKRAEGLKDRIQEAYDLEAKNINKDKKDILKVSLIEFNTLETAPELTADYYIESMKTNIENLAKGLK